MTAACLPQATTTLVAASEAAAAAGLVLRRAVPRGEAQLLVVLTGPDGDVAGQWFADPRRCAAVADHTAADSRAGAVSVHGAHLLVQREGADRRLPELHRLVGDTGTLVAHRPERRGVVAHHTGDRFTKVVSSSRVGTLASALRLAGTWPGVTVPQVVDEDVRRGTLTLATLPGETLHEGLRGAGDDAATALLDAATGVGEALARLHAVPVPTAVPTHDLDAELTVTARWLDLACEQTGLDLDRSGLLRGARARARRHVPGPLTLLHRDLHDKQLLLDGDSVGMLDLDLVARGEAALDLANLLVHLELRARQGLIPSTAVRPLADAVLAGYAPDDATRAALPLHARLTRLRLAGVYAFRPADAEGVVALTSDPILKELS